MSTVRLLYVYCTSTVRIQHSLQKRSFFFTVAKSARCTVSRFWARAPVLAVRNGDLRFPTIFKDEVYKLFLLLQCQFARTPASLTVLTTPLRHILFMRYDTINSSQGGRGAILFYNCLHNVIAGSPCQMHAPNHSPRKRIQSSPTDLIAPALLALRHDDTTRLAATMLEPRYSATHWYGLYCYPLRRSQNTPLGLKLNYSFRSRFPWTPAAITMKATPPTPRLNVGVRRLTATPPPPVSMLG